jgi:hypothetical protein
VAYAPAPAGAYSVTQLGSGDLTLASISCDTGESVDLANRRVTITLTAGERTTCTFVNVGNDQFANARTISGGNGSTTASTAGATKEPGEPNHGGNSGGHSIWFRWTAPASGTVTIDTNGSNYDTLLGVWTGSAVNGLTSVAQDDDSGAGLQSLVSFSATAGTTYRIAVDGWNGASGNVTLNWNQP